MNKEIHPLRERELLDNIRQLREDMEVVSTVTLQRVTRIINTADYLSPEQRDTLLKSIHKGE